ncbi:MAG TPA: zinc ribbon domain-containing protein [Erysipelotrichaceae bacterium]|nr:zinc ribbon domain-containing protein [Erysipelotrichaceae bacterium]
MSHNETEVSCNHCKKIIFKSDKFCPFCGVKNEEIRQDNLNKKCIKCGEPMGVGDVFCGNCGHNQQAERVVEPIQEKPVEVITPKPVEVLSNNPIKPKKKSKLLLIIGIVSLVVVVLFGAVYVYLENEKREAEIARLETIEREENERVNRALNDQLLYWNLEFASPTYDDTYTTFYPFVGATNTDVSDQMCILVGVTANKNSKGKFVLDDSIDGGLFDFELSEFTINDYTPLNSAQECGWNIEDYQVEYNDSFSLYSGESSFVLFKMNLSDLTSDSYNFMYKYMTITSLDTSSLVE